MENRIVRFLISGGSAAAINWFARIGLSLVMPFTPAVILAYVIGMIAGFQLYRSFVWRADHKSWRKQLVPFVVVNLAGAVVVLAAALAFLAIGQSFFGLNPIVEAMAHGAAIAVGAVANYLGHSRITFSPSLPRA